MEKLPPDSQEGSHKIIAAIPCFNTQSFIKDIVSRAKKYVDEVIVIDDGSDDGTARTAQAAGALVISHGQNKGYGQAIKSCFETAKLNVADILVILDGDGQHNPDEIPRLLTPLLSGEVDLVIGSRFLNNDVIMPAYRKFGIRVITFLFNFGSRTKVSDAQSGFRAYSKRALNTITVTELGMSISVETLIKLRAAALKIKEVPISCHYHQYSSTKNPVIQGLGVALSVVRLRLKVRFSKLSVSSTQDEVR